MADYKPKIDDEEWFSLYCQRADPDAVAQSWISILTPELRTYAEENSIAVAGRLGQPSLHPLIPQCVKKRTQDLSTLAQLCVLLIRLLVCPLHSRVSLRPKLHQDLKCQRRVDMRQVDVQRLPKGLVERPSASSKVVVDLANWAFGGLIMTLPVILQTSANLAV